MVLKHSQPRPDGIKRSEFPSILTAHVRLPMVSGNGIETDTRDGGI